MKKKSTLSNILLVSVLVIGLSLLLYPSISNYWNSIHQSKAIASYTETVANLDDDKYEQLWKDAVEFNKDLLERSNSYHLPDELKERYYSVLNPSNSGVMGHVEIPSIGCSLPIYHGTDEAILQVAVGQLDWTSLPTGGESTHCVISGHRGLPSAKLFTDLDQLQVGDVFMLCILDEVLTYEVDQVLIVYPTDTKDLQVVEGKDLCTLVTCTPYGINSHRLLVRGHRIENTPEAIAVRVTADAIQIEPLLVASIIIVPILMILFTLLFISDSRSEDKRY